MSKKTGSGRRFMIAKNLIMMLATLAAILVAIFAWFGSNNEATASGITMKAKTPEKIELAVPEKVVVNGRQVDTFPMDNDDWRPQLDFSTSGFLKNFVKDITSDGKQFVVPNFAAAKNLQEGRKVITDDVWTDGLSSKDALINDKVNDDDQYNYISLDFYVRAKTKDIKIAADSFLAAGSEIGFDGTNVNNNNIRPLVKKEDSDQIWRCSTYGPSEGSIEAFSADAIVGAMRVSLVGAPIASVDSETKAETFVGADSKTSWEDTSALKFLWLPRPDLYLQTSNSQNQWQLLTGIKPNSEHSDKSYCHSFYEGDYTKDSQGNYIYIQDKDGKPTTERIRKGLILHQYSDPASRDVQGTDTSIPQFKVSVIDPDDEEIGKKGYYPTLGQQVSIGDPLEREASNITFKNEKNPEKVVDTTGYYVYKYSLNIWIEGEDAEARRSMNTGVFSLSLSFEG